MFQDFLDLFLELNEAGAAYVLVGGYAVNAHGYTRATSDLDVFVRATPENAARVMEALRAYGLPPGLEASILSEPGSPTPSGFHFGRAPYRVDLLTSITGVTFDEAWSDSALHRLGGVDVRVAGRSVLIRAKRAAGRPKDLADIAALEGGVPRS